MKKFLYKKKMIITVSVNGLKGAVNWLSSSGKGSIKTNSACANGIVKSINSALSGDGNSK